MSECETCGAAIKRRGKRWCDDKCRKKRPCERPGCLKPTYGGRVCPMHQKRMEAWGSYDVRPPKPCALCGREFVPVKKFEGYCSAKCRKKVRKAYNDWYFSDEATKAERALRRKLKTGIAPGAARIIAPYDYASFIANLRSKVRDLNVSAVEFTAADLELRMSMFGLACWLCGGPFEHIDHVKPLSLGGPHMLSNLRPSCQECNARKHNTWPYSAVLEKFAAWWDVVDRWKSGDWTTKDRKSRNMDMRSFLFESSVNK